MDDIGSDGSPGYLYEFDEKAKLIGPKD